MQNRRETLKQSAVVAGLLATAGFPQFAQAYNNAAFQAKNAQDVIKAMGASSLAESKDVTISGPDIAENGAVVPVDVSTTLENVSSISIVVPNNPRPLAASFELMPGTMPELASRIKMGKTSDVMAIVKTDSGLYSVAKEVKVTIGGCGG